MKLAKSDWVINKEWLEGDYWHNQSTDDDGYTIIIVTDLEDNICNIYNIDNEEEHELYRNTEKYG